MKIWEGGKDSGIIADDTENTLTFYAGDSAIELNGDEGKICLSGSIVEMNGGDRTEEIFLRKNAGIMALLPSTSFTPIPQATPNIPIGEITGLIKDIADVFAMMV